MNPYMSWAILLLTAGGLGYYYKNGTAPKARPAFLKPASEKQDTVPAGNKKAKQRNKTRKAQQENSSNSSDGGNHVSPPSAVLETKKEQNIDEAEEPSSTSNGGMDDNYEFAKQFSKVKSGTSLAAKPKPGANTKPKASRAEKPAQQPLSSTNGDSHVKHASTAASSTTGADADDDMSPIGSPVVKPAGDVTDMLEEPAPAASVLRLTGSLEDAQNGKKKKQNNTFKPAETKKQRQARRKREEKNEMVKEAEKNRRNKLENQLHTAREFERQQAKLKPTSPPPNAWASSSTPAADLGAPTNGTSTQPSVAPMPLLDTFEPSQSTPKQAAGEKKSSTKTPWAKDLPSEEEQMRMLNTLSSENEWTTVSNRKKEKRGKNNANAESMSEASSSEPHGSLVETSW
ncbi:hypothetical protein FQN49_000585 [Arthroderma sp. PD_2]|nr:hypothetical protein FQN49_000585 [Arthroderma sp. PD_2]